MVTGVGLADADGTQPIVKKAIVHSAIAAEKHLLCRIINSSFDLVVLALLTSRFEKLFLAVHWCTAGNRA